MTQEHKELLQQWIKALLDIPQRGTNKDEPEGQRFVTFSTTLMMRLTNDLQRILDENQQNASKPNNFDDAESWEQYCERKQGQR